MARQALGIASSERTCDSSCIARRYENEGRTLSVLVRDGHTGLERAVDGFDPSKGFRLSTYATWFIRQAIVRGEANS